MHHSPVVKVLYPIIPRSIWRGKEMRLYTCCLNSLKYAARHRYESVALPLIEMDGDGYPSKKVLQVATRAIEHFCPPSRWKFFFVWPARKMIFLGKSYIGRCPIIWMHIAAAWEEVWAS